MNALLTDRDARLNVLHTLLESAKRLEAIRDELPVLGRGTGLTVKAALESWEPDTHRITRLTLTPLGYSLKHIAQHVEQLRDEIHDLAEAIVLDATAKADRQAPLVHTQKET